MRAIRVLLVILLSAPLLMITAGAYMINGQDAISSYLPGMMVPMGLGSDMVSQASGIPSSIGLSMPGFAFPSMPSTSQSDGSSFAMPDTNVSDLMGQTSVSSIQGCLNTIGSLTSGAVDVNKLVKLPW